MTHRNNQIDLVAALAQEIIRNPNSTDERREWASNKLLYIAKIRTTQRRDLRCKTLQAKLDRALARIAELEAALPKPEQQFNSLRQKLGLPATG